MICDRCQRVIEFENNEIESLQEDVCRMHDFRSTSHVMQIFGICAACQEKAKASGADPHGNRMEKLVGLTRRVGTKSSPARPVASPPSPVPITPKPEKNES